MLAFLQSFIAQFAYAGIVAVLLAAGLGLPVPEDIPLMLGGLLSAQGVTNVFLVFGLAYVSILIGDFAIFSMGRRLGPKALQKPWAARVLTADRQARLNEHFRKHGPLTIIVARHMAGLRAPAFLMAGVARMNPVKFVLSDGAGACLSVPLFIWIGYKFGENLEYILGRIKEYQRLALGLAALAVVGWLAYRWFARRRLADAANAGSPAGLPAPEEAPVTPVETKPASPAPANIP